jgi:hypothetical protein
MSCFLEIPRSLVSNSHGPVSVATEFPNPLFLFPSPADLPKDEFVAEKVLPLEDLDPVSQQEITA